MKILQNKDHFIHKKVNLELYSDGDYFVLLKSFNIPIVAEGNKNSKNKLIDWDQIQEKHSFFYDFEGSEKKISQWLADTEIIEKHYLLTYFISNNEIVKVKTNEFIENWDDFNFAVAFTGIIFISNDGKLILEFTDDYEHQLISNFKIKK